MIRTFALWFLETFGAALVSLFEKLGRWTYALPYRTMAHAEPLPGAPFIHTWRVGLLHGRIFMDPGTGKPYMLRAYLSPESGRLGELWRQFLPGVFLHFFFRSDADRELHNHPWSWAHSLILSGGYCEARKTPEPRPWCREKWTWFFPGDVNTITASDFHRVELLDEAAGAWSLFVAGPRVQSWGFDMGDYIEPAASYHSARAGRAGRPRS